MKPLKMWQRGVRRWAERQVTCRTQINEAYDSAHESTTELFNARDDTVEAVASGEVDYQKALDAMGEVKKSLNEAQESREEEEEELKKEKENVKEGFSEWVDAQ